MIKITTKIKKIQDVVINDVVLSFAEKEENKQWQPVTELHRPIVKQQDQVYVQFDNGGTIVTSTKHPMLHMQSDDTWGYIPTGELTVGSTCKTEHGTTTVTSIDIGYTEDEQFYDITVDSNNNFFAGDNHSFATVIHNSATIFYPLWHLESPDLLVLKNNKGTEENRVRHMDYGVQINGYLWGRLLKNETITLFSPNDVPDLYEAFFGDQELFGELYEKYERSRSIRKKTVSALDHFNIMAMERNNTSRVYVQNVDHSNTHGSFLPSSPVRSSNLCLEITLPTAPLTRKSRIPYIEKFVESVWELSCQEFREEYGEIALCTLGSLNMGAIKSPADFERPAELCIRALDELLDYQNYPMLAAGVPATKRRSLGVGVCNLAYFLAKHNVKYSDGSANDLVHEYAEAMSFYLIKGSMKVAKEKGACDWFEETKYSKGILPIDTYKPAVDDVVSIGLKQDWARLRADILAHGMRHSTVMSLMPVESSSQLINATNGMEPARSIITVKGSKDGTLKQVVPEVLKLKNKYEYSWDMPNTRGYLEIAAIFQKFGDQSISTNTTYNPQNYPDHKVPMSEIMKDMVYAYKLGIKTLYYQNTYDGAGDVFSAADDEEECSSCKL